MDIMSSPFRGRPPGGVEIRTNRNWQSLPKGGKLAATLERYQMPTRNISLTPEQDAFVDKIVKEGEYQNASEAVRDALRLLQQRRREDTLKLKALRAAIKVGVDELDRGEFVELDAAGLRAYMNQLGARRAARR